MDNFFIKQDFIDLLTEKQIINDEFFYKHISPELTQELSQFGILLNKKSRKIGMLGCSTSIILLCLWFGTSALDFSKDIVSLFGRLFFLDFIIKGFLCTFFSSLLDVSKRSSAKKKMQSLAEQAFSEMGLPDDADTMEIFIPKTKEIFKHFTHNPQGWICENRVMKRYYDNQYFYLTDLFSTIRIPLTSFCSISQETQGGRIGRWLQNFPAKKKLGVKLRKKNDIIVPFYTVKICAYEETYELCIPSYELQSFSDITKLRVYE